MEQIKFPKIKGCKFYLVGGCVRDRLLGRKNKDRDFIVLTKFSFNKLVNEINKVGKVFQAKEEFLTIRCKIEDEVIDIAYPRKESDYTDGRHPNKVSRVRTLKEDSSRRDFTINSMYMDEKGKIIDYHNGYYDLKNLNINPVGDAYERFSEDYLRILRAIRFMCQINVVISLDTLETMKWLAHKIKEIDENRIREEINKSLSANPQKTFEYLKELNLFDILKEKGLRFEVTSKQ